MKNIIFDVDDTLYDLMEPFQKAHEELFADQTGANCEELFKASRTYSDEAFYMAIEGKIPNEDEFAYRIIKTYKDVGIDVKREQAKTFEERYRYHQNHIHVPKEIADILTMCQSDFEKIGVLTNGKVKNQGKKIQKLHLSNWFDQNTMFISDEIGAAKPDVQAFYKVQEAMQLKPEETWFIGDTFEVDVVGAKNAGWHVIWFNHRKRPMTEGNIVPDIEVQTAKELKKALQEI